MARVKNATFVGNPPSDVDVDAPSWTRVIKNAIGDLALIYDKVTGLNAEAELLTHTGVRGRGARLGVPWINQTFGGRGDRAGQWGIDLSYTNAAAGGGSKADGSFGSDTIIFGMPVFIPPGESDMSIVITGRGLDVWPWRAQLLLESTGAELFAGELTRSAHPSGLFEQLTLSTDDNGTDAASTGKLCLLLISADTTRRQDPAGTTSDGQIKVYSLFAGPTRLRSGTSPPHVASTSEFNITAGSPFTWRDFDATLFADKAPLHAYITGGASRNLNALIEYITAWRVGGNSAYSLTNFLEHSRNVLATEPEVAWPLLAQAFGAVMLDGKLVVASSALTDGMLDWFALMPVATAGSNRLAAWRARIPDFDSATSRLKVCTLAMSDVMAQGIQWQTEVDVGAAVSSGGALFVQVASTKLMTSKHTAVPFVSDNEADDLELRTGRTGAKLTLDEIAVMGTCFYFEP